MSSIRTRAPAASSPAVRKVMRANMPRDTCPEVLLRSALHRTGLRFRKDIAPEPSLRCRADIVFPRQKTCVFMDGCFWHGCPKHFRTPATNSEWWDEKIEDNRRRDRRKRRRLRSAGWCVIRVWEHDIRSDSLPGMAARIVSAVRGRQKRRKEAASAKVRPDESQVLRGGSEPIGFARRRELRERLSILAILGQFSGRLTQFHAHHIFVSKGTTHSRHGWHCSRKEGGSAIADCGLLI